MNEVQVFNGDGANPGPEVIAQPPDHFLFEKRVICALENIAIQLERIHGALRPTNYGSATTFADVDQFFSKLRGFSFDTGTVFLLAAKMKKDIGDPSINPHDLTLP